MERLVPKSHGQGSGSFSYTTLGLLKFQTTLCVCRRIRIAKTDGMMASLPCAGGMALSGTMGLLLPGHSYPLINRLSAMNGLSLLEGS